MPAESTALRLRRRGAGAGTLGDTALTVVMIAPAAPVRTGLRVVGRLSRGRCTAGAEPVECGQSLPVVFESVLVVYDAAGDSSAEIDGFAA